MKQECNYYEEEFVDYILNVMDANKREVFSKHLMECDQCTEKVNDWKILLESNSTAIPSKSLKKKLRANIKKTPRKKYYFPGIVLSASMVVLVAFLFFSPINNRSTDTALVHQNYNLTAQNVMNNPDSEKIHIAQMKNQQNIVGDIWLDQLTNEMFMQMEGIKPLLDGDYQVWLLHSNNTVDSQILRIQDGKVYLYYKGPKEKKIKLIRISIEPTGGSRYPTGPDAIKVNVQ